MVSGSYKQEPYSLKMLRLEPYAFLANAVMSSRFAIGNGTSSGAEKCLGELGVSKVVDVGVGVATAESTEGAAAVVVGVLAAVIGVGRRGACLSFSFSLE
ncbi:Hypothetical predicted protein [Octopus vulgaris]|uniref:Uncharacterized protein n=1 Tax=Octopus vulgaris TaxID=6645 RepID=A0AA36F8Z7_OCTVU|nr:Hypothetical predicted protein [Octopus vulgaris]